MGNRADEYRRLARECMTLATRMATEEARSVLIEMARVWTSLADAQSSTLPRGTHDVSPPVVRHEQQVPPQDDGGTG
jgi:hypothetical protein